MFFEIVSPLSLFVIGILFIAWMAWKIPGAWEELKFIGRLFREMILHPINPSQERVHGKKRT